MMEETKFVPYIEEEYELEELTQLHSDIHILHDISIELHEQLRWDDIRKIEKSIERARNDVEVSHGNLVGISGCVMGIVIGGSLGGIVGLAISVKLALGLGIVGSITGGYISI